MNVETEYERWIAKLQNDTELNKELEDIRGNENEIQDRFYRGLEFGTGGLRGVMGAGTNRMNIYTVGRATAGLADYLHANFKNPRVCVAFDTRNMSREFARLAARVFCFHGVKAHIFDAARPTPMLSFAVRYKKASAGIVITASHNPREYNGYKVYGPDGVQITDRAASEISAFINKRDYFDAAPPPGFNECVSSGMVEAINIDRAYCERVKSLVMRRELIKNKADSLKIIYTPLNGTGNVPVCRVLRELGFSRVHVVKEQETPDGNFTTVPYPNPEEPSVFRLALEKARTFCPDVIMATDPDCDRMGVMAKDNLGEYCVLSGNQTGALLCDYIIRTKKELGVMPPNPAVIKTVVTSDIGKKICRGAGVETHEVLTGFKYIGELAEKWSATGEHSFLFGYEESFGYLAGDFVRDKDGVAAAALIAEMTLYYREKSVTLFQALDALYKEHGYYREKLISVTMSGAEGREKTAGIISYMRINYLNVFKKEHLAFFEDYEKSARINCDNGTAEVIKLPPSRVLKFIFSDGSWLALRPSGTEPKIKAYISAAGNSREEADMHLLKLEKTARLILN